MTPAAHSLFGVRVATIDDAAALSLVAAATFLQTFASLLDGPAIVEHCREKLDANSFINAFADGQTIWIAEHGDTRAPIGFAQFGPSTLPRSQTGDVELKRIYVLSEFHGLGVARQLWEQAKAAALRAAAPRILLGVYKNNLRARAFYEKLGFDYVCDRQFKVGDRYFPDTVLALDLSFGPSVPRPSCTVHIDDRKPD